MNQSICCYIIDLQNYTRIIRFIIIFCDENMSTIFNELWLRNSHPRFKKTRLGHISTLKNRRVGFPYPQLKNAAESLCLHSFKINFSARFAKKHMLQLLTATKYFL